MVYFNSINQERFLAGPSARRETRREVFPLPAERCQWFESDSPTLGGDPTWHIKTISR
jgi:hypothetical protein